MTNTKQALSVRDLVLIALFTAMTAVLAQISIPMPLGVPMTLQTLAIPLASVLLGAKRGTISCVVYVLLGTVGVPVFANFQGGAGIVFGPTGGFILSFPLMAYLSGLGTDHNNKPLLWSGLIAGAAINFIGGMLMFSAITGKSLTIAFTACVLPFLPTAAAKILITGMAGAKIRATLQKAGMVL